MRTLDKIMDIGVEILNFLFVLLFILLTLPFIILCHFIPDDEYE